MRRPPEEVVRTWPTPNYDNPERRGDALLIVELTIMILAVIFLGLRLFVRGHLIGKFWVDDWLIIAATIFSIGVTICVILAEQLYGWGIHVWDVELHNLINGRKAGIAAQTLFLFASALAKMSILFTYKRIAASNTPFKRLTEASIVLVVVLLFVFLIVLWTQCIPAYHYWTLNDGSGCVAEGPPLLGQNILAVLTDFIVFSLPLPTLADLNMPNRQRVALLVIFSFGFLVVVAGCLRTYWMWKVVHDTYDVTWYGFELWIWTAVEVNLGVICCCTPFLKPLLGGLLDKVGTRKGSRTSAKSTSKWSSRKFSGESSRRKLSGQSSRKPSDQSDGSRTLDGSQGSRAPPPPIMIESLKDYEVAQKQQHQPDPGSEGGAGIMVGLRRWAANMMHTMSWEKNRRPSDSSGVSVIWGKKKKKSVDMPPAWEQAAVSPVSSIHESWHPV